MDVSRFGLTRAGQVLLHALINLIALLLTLEAEQEGRLFRLARHPVHLEQFELQADLEQLEASMEKFCEVRYLVIDHLLVVQVVIGLEINARVCHEEQAFDLDEW